MVLGRVDNYVGAVSVLGVMANTSLPPSLVESSARGVSVCNPACTEESYGLKLAEVGMGGG